jgi:NAD(P)-dependent dehydrogenase (short-subunit alcohol dehydrogenase family)
VDFLNTSNGAAAPALRPLAAAPSATIPAQTEPLADVLLKVVAEKTGYPAEMLQLDMELDADLGIDSIKRVEIFSALQECLPEAPTLKPEHLGTLRSLRHVVEFLVAGSPSASHEPRVTSSQNKSALPSGSRPSNVAPLHRYALTSRPLENSLTRPAVTLVPGGDIWVTDDGSGLASHVTQRLDLLGHRCRLIGWNDLATLERPAQLSGLVMLAAPGELGDDFLKDAFQLLQLAAQGLRHSGRAGGAIFVTVARLDGAFALAGAGGNAICGGLAGLAKTAAHEWPEVQCKAIDLATDWTDTDESALALVDEMLLASPQEVGLSQGGKQAPCLTEIPLAQEDSTSLLQPGDVVVLTGGARGVTAEVAVALAGTFAPTLVLLGRSPAPHPEPAWLAPLTDGSAIKRALLEQSGGQVSPKEIGEQYRQVSANREMLSNIDRMEAAGARVFYRSVDVRDAAAVGSVMEEVRAEFGPIKGIVHGAGVLADRSIEDKTQEQFDLVYDTKVGGLRNVLQAAGEEELKLLVLFSSSTGRFGRKGQADYAAANEVLNKMAQQHARRWTGCRVVAVNWGPWDGGMVTPGLKKVFEKEQIGLIPLAAGADYLVREISQQTDRPVEVVVLASAVCSSPLSRVGERGCVSAPSTPGADATGLGSMQSMPFSTAFERELNLEDYPFLQAHVLDGHAVLPLAMIVEWLAHGALHANPGLVYHGFEELRVLKGVILEDDRPSSVRVLAGRAGKQDGGYRVPMELRSTSADGRDVLHARADVLLAASLRKPERPVPDIALRPYHRSPQAIYQELLFHGPALQGIAEVEGCSEQGIVVTVKAAPAPAAWIRQPLRNSWLADPLALDCAFQMMILWSFEEHGSGSLPCFVGRYRQFQRTFPRDGCRIVAAVKKHGSQRAWADIAFLDRAGKVIACMDDYECVIDASLQQCFRRNQISSISV